MRDGPLLIAQLDPPHAGREGDWYYRTYVPGRALAEEPGVHVVNLDNVHRRKGEVLRAADVLILNSVVDPDLLPLLQERRARGQVTVYEISDDVSAVPAWNPVHYFFRNRDNLNLFLRLAHACDGNQYSVVELRRLYGYLNPRGCVLENQLIAAPPRRAPQAGDELVIGWGGSRGHLEDMGAVAGPLMSFIDSRPGLRLHLMCADAIWRLFDWLPASRKRRTAPGSIDAYYAFLRGVDIGIAPLLDSGFNRSRSDVKLVEYAAHGAAPVVQRLVPYLGSAADGRNALLFEDADGLVAALRRLADDPALRRSIAAAAYEEIAAPRIQSRHCGERLSFYRELLDLRRSASTSYGDAGQRGAGVDRAAFFDELRRWEGAEGEGRHAVLGATRYERLLYDGLVLSQQQGQGAEGARLFREAARLQPDDHQPYLCLAAAGQDPAVSFVEALRRSPRSLQVLMGLGMTAALRGDVS